MPTNLVEYVRLLQAAEPDLPLIVGANGASMAPSIVKGDRIHLRRPTGRVRLGDVVLARTETGRHVIHRVVAVEPWVETRGDGVAESDGPVSEVLMLVERVEKTWRSRLRRLTLKIEAWLQ